MLVVNPNNRLNTPRSAVEPPLWALLIASYHNADILDAEGEDLNMEETVERIFGSDHKNILIVVMGNNPSVSSTPKMTIAEVLAGELDGLNVSMTGLHPIACGSRYPVIKTPFEGLPKPDWYKLGALSKYRAHNWHCLGGIPRSPYASIYTSLGCPYDCYYCNIHTLYGKRKVQFRPLEDIYRDISILAYQGVHNLKIWDELFTLRESRVIEICRCLMENQFNVWAYARLDTVTPKMLEWMKAGGISWLAYGFESVKDSKFIKRADEVIKMTRDAGINIIANFMFGLPHTTEDDDKRSVEFAMKHLFEWVNFYDAKPYPGSQWYQDTEPEIKWQDFNQYKNISPFRQKAFDDYFTNPDYLSMIKRKFGNQAVDEVSGTVRCKIKV